MVGTSGSSPTDSRVGAPTKKPRLGSPAWPFRGIVTTPKAAFCGQPAPGCRAAGINMAAHVTVTVWGKPHVVSVYQKSKNVWIAAGQCKDEQIQVTDSDYSSAIKRWRETATDRGK
jgi:hypothetical protein